MKYLTSGIILLLIIFLLAYVEPFKSSDLKIEKFIAAYRKGRNYKKIDLIFPPSGTVFPPEFFPPTFNWKDPGGDSDIWIINMNFKDNKGPMSFFSDIKAGGLENIYKPEWTPQEKQWERIKERTRGQETQLSILGFNSESPKEVISIATASIRVAEDEVGAPLFYREVNLPFKEAVKDPSKIRWRFGPISSKKTQPPIVLENLPVCGNCHSFSSDGKIMGLDVDYANDKGSYAILKLAEKMVIDSEKIITWADFKREEKEMTFGLLSQISPDGKYVVSTVNDRSVFVPQPDLAFSQLFFPLKGILAFYHMETKEFYALPGADDRQYVQSNPTWSPDGKYILFARSRVGRLKKPIKKGGGVLLTPEECSEFLKDGRTFKFDLYRIPFNDGKGGKAEPIEGASNNGMSNYFPKFSPDGKWIVFCKAKSFMLLQPDSQLFIIPAAGGKARLLNCNTPRMNSWHSFSPNGHWMIFSSKKNGPFTQVFLTHFNKEGYTSPAICLSHLTSKDRAVNIPEFVNARPDAIKKIQEQFLDDTSFSRAADQFIHAGDVEGAIRLFKKGLLKNPKNPFIHFHWGIVLFRSKKYLEAKKHFKKTIELKPDLAEALYYLGMIWFEMEDMVKSEQYFQKTLEFTPKSPLTHNRLGEIYAFKKNFVKAAEYFKNAVFYKPDYIDACSNLGFALFQQEKFIEANNYLHKALALRSSHQMAKNILMDPQFQTRLAAEYAKGKRFSDAVQAATLALQLARQIGQMQLAKEIQKKIIEYGQGNK
ncbi:tetratricopeptide repeat protein [Candidatus Riflebacteria bacterium]